MVNFIGLTGADDERGPAVCHGDDLRDCRYARPVRLRGMSMETWIVDEETWEWLMQRLSEPAKDSPKLRALFERPTVFDTEV